jgi:hypothetical protein
VADFNENTSPCPCNVVERYSNTAIYTQSHSARKISITSEGRHNHEAGRKLNILATYLMIVSSSAYSILKTEVTNSSGTSTDFQRANWRYDYISECSLVLRFFIRPVVAFAITSQLLVVLAGEIHRKYIASLIKLAPNSMEMSPAQNSNSCSATPQFPCLL